MSRSSLYCVEPGGEVVHFEEFANAWRGAMLIWTDFAVRYGIVPREDEALLLIRPQLFDAVWKLGRDRERVPRRERIVMLATFDRALCRAGDFPELIEALRDYDASLPADQRGSHALLWADAIGRMPRGTLGCGWQQTSVSRNLWQVEGPPETDDDGNEWDPECLPYNINEHHDHFWIFDELDEPARVGEVS